MLRKIALNTAVYMLAILSLIFVSFVSAQDISELAQSRVRSCLQPNWNGIAEGRGSMKRNSIHLTGTCLSPSGCECILNQLPNNSVAADQAGDNSACDEAESVLGTSTALLAKVDPEEKVSRKSMAKTDAEKRAIDLGNRCSKHIREANDPVLGSVPTGPRKCNVIKNNLIAKSSSSANNNVLGVNNSGLIPYGPVDIIVEEDTYKHSPINFSAVGDLEPTITNNEDLGTGEVANGNDATQKLGRITFTLADFDLSPENLQTNCASITWDPYGRVFDAQSLEPIIDTELTLIDELTGEPTIMEFSYNSDITGQDGLFNIQVEKEGKYSLMIDPLTPHQFIATPKLSPYWSKIYSDLYSPGVTFYEKSGVATHHDIPLVSNGSPYRGAVSTVVPGSLSSQSIGEYIIYTGRQTFPMANVCLINETTGKIVGKCVNANNIGKFSIVIKKSQIPTEKLIVKTEKVDLNDPKLYAKDHKTELLHLNSIFISKKGISKSYSFEPILSMVEGYTYGKNGKIKQNMQVSVKLLMNNQEFYKTKSDEQGYFKINAKNLPYVEYYLEFIDPVTKEKFKKTTSQFVNENRLYLEKEGIDLITASKKSVSTENNATNSFDQSLKNDDSSKKNNLNIQLAKIILIIILLLIITLGIIFYIKKTRST